MDARLDLEVALADELWLAVEENVSALERRPSGEWHDMIVGRTGRSA